MEESFNVLKHLKKQIKKNQKILKALDFEGTLKKIPTNEDRVKLAGIMNKLKNPEKCNITTEQVYELRDEAFSILKNIKE